MIEFNTVARVLSVEQFKFTGRDNKEISTFLISTLIGDTVYKIYQSDKETAEILAGQLGKDKDYNFVLTTSFGKLKLKFAK